MPDNIHNHKFLKFFLQSFFLAIITLQFSRIIFLTYNFESFGHHSFLEILNSFWVGFRFDLVYLSYFLSPFFLAVLIQKETHTKINFILKSYFTIVISLGFLLNMIDTFYYSYSLKRSGVELFQLINDPANPILSYLIEFWYLLLFVVIVVYIIWKLYPKNIQEFKFGISWKLVGFVSLAILLFIGMRGGIGLKPIKSQDASKWVAQGLENLTLSTPFQIISSIDSDKEEFPFKDIATFEDSAFTLQYGSISSKPNLVLIILESMGRDYIGFLNEEPIGITPFLDSFSKHCLTFVNTYANATRSVEAVPALFAGIPHVLNKTFQYSIFQGNKIKGVHHYLNELAYDNSFYHGAANGTMGFESFLKKSGTISYYGINQYPKRKKHFDGKWGIFDHHYMDYFADELKQKTEPFFASFFSLSSHHPFAIPKEYKNTLPEGFLPIHKSVAYTDASLKIFFEKVAQNPTHHNTIYIIIGDHTSHSHREYYASSKGRLELFCMMYDARGEIAAGFNTKTVQQIDILPTLLDLAGYDQPFVSLGSSFFDTSVNKGALTFIDGSYQYLKNEHVFRISPNGDKSFFTSPKNNLPHSIQNPTIPEQKEELESELISTLGFFWDRMRKNRFF